MNTFQVFRFPKIGLLIVALALLAASILAVLIPSSAWSLISTQRASSSIQVDPLGMAHAFHTAINSSDKDSLLALFAGDATVTDNGTLVKGKEQIHNWVFYSPQMAGLRLTEVHAEAEGEKVIWLDTAHNISELKSRYYILRWEAIIRDGKIQSLVVMRRYMPDMK